MLSHVLIFSVFSHTYFILKLFTGLTSLVFLSTCNLLETHLCPNRHSDILALLPSALCAQRLGLRVSSRQVNAVLLWNSLLSITVPILQ